MKFPDYPSNREADEKAFLPLSERMGRRLKVEAKSGNLYTQGFIKYLRFSSGGGNGLRLNCIL